MLNSTEYVLGTEQCGQRSDAALKDAQIKLKREECVEGMVQRGNDAASKNAQIMRKREECASSTEQRSNYAAVMDATKTL